jgi:hypothetical protein
MDTMLGCATPAQTRARFWVGDVMSSAEIVALSRRTLIGFVQVTTRLIRT